MELNRADATVSIDELKRDPDAVIGAAGAEPVAVLVHGEAVAYLVPAATYRNLIERLDDLELVERVRSRAGERRIMVELDKL